MARKPVVEVQCDRCSRIEHREVKPADGSKDKALVFGGQLTDSENGNLEVAFGDLCAPCLKTVRNHLEQIAKKLEGSSPDRKGKELLEDMGRSKRGEPLPQNGRLPSSGVDTEVQDEG